MPSLTEIMENKDTPPQANDDGSSISEEDWIRLLIRDEVYTILLATGLLRPSTSEPGPLSTLD